MLPDHLAHKIRSGATRNLVIRHCNTQHTEDEVREDLDHIHNLVVVRIDFIQGNCYISTNSVACASFARTCMMSRLYVSSSTIFLSRCLLTIITEESTRAPVSNSMWMNAHNP